MFDLLDQPLEGQIQLGIKGMISLLCERYGKETGLKVFEKLVDEIKAQHIENAKSEVK